MKKKKQGWREITSEVKVTGVHEPSFTGLVFEHLGYPLYRIGVVRHLGGIAFTSGRPRNGPQVRMKLGENGVHIYIKGERKILVN